jgi:putative hemolysin
VSPLPSLAPSSVVAAELTSADVWMLVGVGALLLVTALLAAADAALSRTSRSRAQSLVDEGARRAPALLGLVEAPDRYVNPLLLAALTAQLVQATLVGVVSGRLFGAVGVAVAAALNVVVVFVVAASLPRTWAVLNPERAALAAARPVSALVRFPPLRLASRTLIGLTNLLLPGRGLAQGPYVSHEQLLAVAEQGVEEGVIDEGERDLIESIIEFGSTIVREVMVPRPDMVAVAAHFRVADVIEVVLLNGYSRLPVYGDGLDDVIGLAYAKDLMRAERDGEEDRPVVEIARPAQFVPETKRVPAMLREMQHDKFHMAIVVDEYGGTAGLVTLEDIIEELVGDIVDEYDLEAPHFESVAGGGVRVPARTPLDDVNDLLGVELPQGDWDTIGGLLYSELGRVPAEGEFVEVGPWRLAAQRIQGRRIGRVCITPVRSPASSVGDPSERTEGAGSGRERSVPSLPRTGPDAGTPRLPADPADVRPGGEPDAGARSRQTEE